MDRLSFVVAAGLGVALACGGENKPAADGASNPANNRRVNAVVAAASAVDPAADFCEQGVSAAEAKTFAWPALANGPAPGTGKWRWINVWATWCKPCIAEMPMMVRWRDRLRDDKLDAEIVFFSVDEGQEVVDSFAPKHPEVPTDGPRIADVEGLEPWLLSIGLTANAVLPIHLFVDPQDKLRCVRMGGVSAEDYGAIKSLIAAG